MEDLQPLLKTADIARLFGISPRAVHLKVERGTLPQPLRIGHQFYWEPKDLRNWLDSHRSQ